jgi:hypothetical protein
VEILPTLKSMLSNAVRPPTPVRPSLAPPELACVMVSTFQRALHAGRAVRAMELVAVD